VIPITVSVPEVIQKCMVVTMLVPMVKSLPNILFNKALMASAILSEEADGNGSKFLEGNSSLSRDAFEKVARVTEHLAKLFHKVKRVKLWVLRTRQKLKGTSSMPHPAESGDRSRAVRVAGSDLTDYANPPRLFL
jgi:hypothetical protein